METLYRRPLPEGLVPFASPRGRELFREALAEGSMEGYFRLAQQFHTQADPAFCSLGSLVVALNALDIDPGRLWRGPWRWFSEELLDCCMPHEHVRANGMTLDELACLARCNGADATVFRPDVHGLDEFRAQVVATSATTEGPVLIANYSRTTLGQTGSGHYSPIAGYHEGSDSLLILDVARFKYPPHWVALDRLYEAYVAFDDASGRSRGWLSLTASEARLNLGFAVESSSSSWAAMTSELQRVLARALVVAPPPDIASAAAVYLEGVVAAGVHLRAQESRAPEHEARQEDIHDSLASSEIGALAATVAPPTMDPVVAAMLLATAPPRWTDALTPEVRAEWRRLLSALPEPAHREAHRIATQLEEIMCACATRR